MSEYYNSQKGRYGVYGGCYIPELLVSPVNELKAAFMRYRDDPGFCQSLNILLNEFASRPTPLMEAVRLRQHYGGPRICLKREDTLHTGAHKLNNVLGQCLLARYMGKTRVIAETGAGQHGYATATACAHLGLNCTVYMGAYDMERQSSNVEKMRLLGAHVQPVDRGQCTLKEAVNMALQDWAEHFHNTHYCLGSVLGPDPYPEMVAFFHRVIGEETREQCLRQMGRLPDEVIACVGGGSNALGIFMPFVEDEIRLIGVEAAGSRSHSGGHAARFLEPSCGVLHGSFSYLLQTETGQVKSTSSIAAGLDYPMIGPCHAELHDRGRAQYITADDSSALEAFKTLSQLEGIIPALESSHALAGFLSRVNNYDPDELIVINISGRGDKDLARVIHSQETNDAY